MTYDNSNTIALWKNEDKREGKKDPEYRGQGEVDGRLYWADCWINTAKSDGRKFLSIKLKEKEQRQERAAPARKAEAPSPNDDIPF